MIRINKKFIITCIFFSFLFLPFCISTTFKYIMPSVYFYARYIRVIFCIITVVYALAFVKGIYKHWVTMLMLVLYLGILFFSTWHNKIDMSFFINYAVMIIFFVFLFLIAAHAYTREIFNAIWFVCFALNVINIISILKYPNGLYYRYDIFADNRPIAYWFLGNKNLYIDYLLPMIFLSILNKHIFSGGNTKLYISILLSLASVVLTGSATTLFIIALVIIYCLFLEKGERFKKIMDPLILFGVYAFASVFIIFGNKNAIFKFVVVDLLKKDVTLSSRTIIWGNIISRIKLSPIFGYGYRSGTDFISNGKLMHAHNLFVHIAYSGGLVALAVLLAWIIISILKLRKFKNSNLYKLFSAFFLIYMCMEFSEPRIYFPFTFAVFVLIYNIDYYDKLIVEEPKTERYFIRWKRKAPLLQGQRNL